MADEITLKSNFNLHATNNLHMMLSTKSLLKLPVTFCLNGKCGKLTKANSKVYQMPVK